MTEEENWKDILGYVNDHEGDVEIIGNINDEEVLA